MSETIQIPKGWKITTFTDIVKNEKYAIKRGPWGSSIKKDFFVPDGYKVYQQHNVIYDDFEFGDYFLDEKKFDELKEFEIKSDDILISCSGTIGKVARVPPNVKKGVMNQALLKISPDDLKINSDFFLYLLKSSILQNKIMAKGTAMKNIVSVSNLKKISFNVPMDLKIQKQIVAKLDHILGELEVKKKEIISIIEQNKERIDFFEKNWYSFSISNLIENHPQRNEWDTSLLEQVADVIDPHPSHRAPPKQNDGYPFAGIGDISVDGTINIQKARKIGETFVIQQEKAYEINEKSIGYGRVASVGKVMRLRKQKFRYAISPTLAVINPNSNINHDFLFYMLKSNYFFKQVSKQTTGSTREALGIMKLRKLSVLVPMPTQQKDIVKKIKNLEEKFQSQKKQFENIKNNYESKIKYINHIQSSVLDSAFSGKLIG